MEAEFLDLMPHTITLEPYIRRDFRGTSTYGPARSYRCRIVGKGLALRDRSGNTDDSVIFDIYVDAGNDVVREEDRITLPDDQVWLDRTPTIFTVGRFADDHGHHHTKIQCGWQYHRQGQ